MCYITFLFFLQLFSCVLHVSSATVCVWDDIQFRRGEKEGTINLHHTKAAEKAIWGRHNEEHKPDASRLH